MWELLACNTLLPLTWHGLPRKVCSWGSGECPSWASVNGLLGFLENGLLHLEDETQVVEVLWKSVLDPGCSQFQLPSS